MGTARQRVSKTSAFVAAGAVLGAVVGAAAAQPNGDPPGTVACPPSCPGSVQFRDCYYTCCSLGVLCDYCTNMSVLERVLAGCGIY